MVGHELWRETLKKAKIE